MRRGRPALIAICVASMLAVPGLANAAEPTPTPSPRVPAVKGDKLPVPGDNGTVKIHRSTTPDDDPRNEPKVCTFYLVGFGFDAEQSIWWKIRSWPPTGDRTVVKQGMLTLDEDGHGRTDDLNLPDGHYKLFWNFEGEKGAAKHKVFWVKCKRETPTPTPTPTPTTTSPTPSPTPTSTSTGGTQPSPSSTPTPSSEPTSPASNGGNLPFTGFPAAVLAAVALALLIGGGAAVIIARRRRMALHRDN